LRLVLAGMLSSLLSFAAASKSILTFADLLRDSFSMATTPRNRMLSDNASHASRYSTQMVHRPEVDPLLCFILMPFRQPFDGYYQHIIKPAIISVGMNPLIKGRRDLWDWRDHPRHLEDNLDGSSRYRGRY
jgi:hypothetical protein